MESQPGANSTSTAPSRACADSRVAGALFLLLVATEVYTLAATATHRAFWYDELLTLYISSLRPVAKIFAALQAGADGMPPAYYLLVVASSQIPGDTHLVMRLLALAGQALAFVGTYLFVLRRYPAATALTAVILLTFTPFEDFTIQARSYALLTGCVAMAAAVWQRVDGSRWAAPVLCFLLLIAVSCHHLAVLILAVFAAGELAFYWMERKVRWPVWTALAAASIPFFVQLPLLISLKNLYGTSFWSMATWRNALSTYGNYTGFGAIETLLLIAAFAAASAPILRNSLLRRSSPVAGYGFPEIVLIAGLIVYPAALVIVALIQKSGYVPRYGWPAVIGLVLAATYLLSLPRAIPYQRHLVLVLAAIFVARHVQREVNAANVSLRDTVTTAPEFRSRLRSNTSLRTLEALEQMRPDLPVVVASGDQYLEMFHYSSAAVRSRLYQFVDLDKARQFARVDSVEKTNYALARFAPLQTVASPSFLETNSSFLVVHQEGLKPWVTPYLRSLNFRLGLLWRDNLSEIYLAER